MQSEEMQRVFKLRFEVTVALATSSEWELADVREELLQKILAEDPMIAKVINDYRRQCA